MRPGRPGILGGLDKGTSAAGSAGPAAEGPARLFRYKEGSTKRVSPIIAVSDVPNSAARYVQLLESRQTHPGGTVFDQIVHTDITILSCLHHWGPSGPRGDHDWSTVATPPQDGLGNGLSLWFVVDDFDAAWERAPTLETPIEEEPSTDNGTGRRAFVAQDLDGYHVAVNEARPVGAA